MDINASPIPTPRALLTSLLNTLFMDPASPTSHLSNSNSTIPPTHSTAPNPQPSPPSNPLKLIPASQRALLATLHVLFPPPMLLQALDLLDRGLVTKVSLRAEAGAEMGERDDGEDDHGDGISPQGRDNPIASENTARNNVPTTSTPTTKKSISTSKKKRANKHPALFQVRSSQPPKSRFRDHLAGASSISGTGAPAGGNTYTVHLAAWNCSCAAFAFAAFPASAAAPWSADALSTEDAEGDGDDDWNWGLREGSGGEKGIGRVKGRGRGKVRAEGVGSAEILARRELGVRTGEDEGVYDSTDDLEEEEERWEFGGLSFDGRGGREGGSAPVCKHLLACLLGDKWKVLRGYVRERDVGREEMAGLEGD